MFKIGAFYCPRESKRIFLWTCIPREFWIKVWAAWFQRASLIAIHSVCITCKSSVLRARRVPHGAFKEEMRDSLSPSPSLLSPPPPLLFGFHWKSFFFFAVSLPEQRVLIPLVISHLGHCTRSLWAPEKDRFPFSSFFDLLVLHRCVCASLCVCLSVFAFFPCSCRGNNSFSQL